MIFKALDPDMPDDEVEQIISEVDEDGSGTVDYEGKNYDFFHLNFLFFFLFHSNRILQINDRLNKYNQHDCQRIFFFINSDFLFFF